MTANIYWRFAMCQDDANCFNCFTWATSFNPLQQAHLDLKLRGKMTCLRHKLITDESKTYSVLFDSSVLCTLPEFYL